MLSILLLLQVRCLSVKGSHDRFFLDVKFFRLLLGAVPEVIYSIGEDKSSLCLSGSTSDVFNI